MIFSMISLDLYCFFIEMSLSFNININIQNIKDFMERSIETISQIHQNNIINPSIVSVCKVLFNLTLTIPPLTSMTAGISLVGVSDMKFAYSIKKMHYIGDERVF